jgi:cardiolipin synthase
VIRSLVRARRLRFTEGNRVEIFGTGREGLAAMLEAVEQARDRVHLETYILRSDAMGRRFFAALTSRARDGVDVRLLYDSFGSRGLDTVALADLVAAGAEVVAFNPLARPYPSFAPRRRDHRKILVVDGRVAFTGGLNIGEEYIDGIGGSHDEEWRDAHARVEGPVVRDLEAVFLESWFRADGPGLPWGALLVEEPPAAGNVRCAVLADGPVYRRRRMRDLIVSALDAAHEEVLLESPYFAPGRPVLDALSRASERGVRVQLLLAGHSDHPVLRRAARSIVPRLLAAGVRVHEYGRAMMHAKLAVFDRQWGVIGTSNLDRQSFEHNFEVNLIVEGEEPVEALRDRIHADLEGAREVDLDALAARGPLERFVDGLASLVLYFL